MKPDTTSKTLKRTPGVSEAGAKTVAAPIAHVDDVATKGDIKELRTEVGELRTSTQKEFKEVRAYTQNEFKEVRAYTQNEFKEVRKEIGGLQTSTQNEFKEVRESTQKEFKELQVSTQKQAEALQATREQMATKTDLAELKSALTGRMLVVVSVCVSVISLIIKYI